MSLRQRMSIAVFAGFLVLFGWSWERYVIARAAPGFVVSGRPLEWFVRGPGLVDATNKVSVTAKVPGRLTAVHVDRNQRVQRGDVIAELEADDLKSQLASARADAEAARDAISIAQATERRATALLDKVRTDLARKERLASTGVASRVEIETLDSLLRQAEADWQGAQTSVQRAHAHLRAAESNVSVVLARLDEATIRSPLNGLVVQRERSVGDVVTPGVVIAQIVDPASIIISGRFDESNMAAVSAGQPARAAFVSAPRTEYHGAVWRIGRLVDQETREFTADVTLDELPSNWAIGQRATVLVRTTTDPRLLLAPHSFVERQGGKAGVWVLEGERARRRDVTLGAPVGPFIEIVDGLTADAVIVAPARRYAFERVRPQLSWP